MIAKADLPTKLCPICGRVYVWRKKWAKNWPDVKYCSKKCAGSRLAHPFKTH